MFVESGNPYEPGSLREHATSFILNPQDDDIPMQVRGRSLLKVTPKVSHQGQSPRSVIKVTPGSVTKVTPNVTPKVIFKVTLKVTLHAGTSEEGHCLRTPRVPDFPPRAHVGSRIPSESSSRPKHVSWW